MPLIPKVNPIVKGCKVLDEAYRARADFRHENRELLNQLAFLEEQVEIAETMVKGLVRPTAEGRKGTFEAFAGQFVRVSVQCKEKNVVDMDALATQLPPDVVSKISVYDQKALFALVDEGHIESDLVAKYTKKEPMTPAISFVPVVEG